MSTVITREKLNKTDKAAYEKEGKPNNKDQSYITNNSVYLDMVFDSYYRLLI